MTRTVKPSDFVTWKVRDDNRSWTLTKLGSSTTFLDTAPERYGSTAVRNPRWTARIYDREQRPVWDLMDPDARIWTLVTQGPDVGGRRYRTGLTMAEAQYAALAWLDRRFKVENAWVMS